MRRPSNRECKPGVAGLEKRDLPATIAPIARPVAVSVAVAPLDDAATPTLTAREIARQRFVAGFVGTYGAGAPQFTDQSRQIAIVAKGGGNQFLHGNLVLKVNLPGAAGGNFEGSASLRDRNVNNTLLLDLRGDPSSLDRFGRPTRMSWTVNNNGSGTYTASNGSGVLTIRYPGGKASGNGAGQAVVNFQGSVNTTNVSNPNVGVPYGPARL